MDCKKANELIIIFSELSTTEKHELDEHLEGCPACKLAWQEQMEFQQLIQSAKSHQIAPLDAGRLTMKVMERVGKPKKTEPVAWFSMRSIRIAMTSVSLFLAITFVYEYSIDGPAAASDKSEDSGTSRLSVQGFQVLKKEKEPKTISLYALIQNKHESH